MSRAICFFLLFITNVFMPLLASSEPYALTLSAVDGESTTETGVLTIETNRTEGVAPLSVSFDLTLSVFDNEDTLMLGEFMWDFGDEGDDYNIGKGYCPSHVYREPGSYTATVTAHYNDIVKTKSVIVTVSEFAGTTYFISADGSDSNDGLSKSTPFKTPAYAFDNFLGQNVRFLLRQGDTFIKSSSYLFGEHGDTVLHGPVIFNSYRDPSNPSDEKPIIYDTRDDVPFTGMFSMLNVDDFRIVNLIFQGKGGDVDHRDTTAHYPSGIVQSSVTPSTNTLILDCDIIGAGSTSLHIEGSYHVVQDCTVRNGGSYGVFVTEGIHCAFIGLSMKEFANHSPEYTMRLSTHIVGNYVAYCDLWGDYTKCTFQIRGDDSSYNYVYHNQMDRFTGINQTNNKEDETLHHNTFDSNIVVMRDYEGNTSSGTYDRTGYYTSSNKCMIRNNIIYGFSHSFGIGTHEIVGGSKTVWLHNNTGIGIAENSNFLDMRKAAKGVELKNNIYYNSAETMSYGDRFISITAVSDTEPTYLNEIHSDYNVFFGAAWKGEASQTIVGVAYSDDDPTLPIWRSDFSNGLSSQFADALLNVTIDTDDVTTSLDNGFSTVYSLSPAIDAGNPNIIYTRFDFFGNKRSDLTIGAIGK